jgi:hypothetical protein
MVFLKPTKMPGKPKGIKTFLLILSTAKQAIKAKLAIPPHISLAESNLYAADFLERAMIAPCVP